ncbi:protein of unknown function DUF303, acetylesterase putative, partial [Nannochloropsis gaditana]
MTRPGQARAPRWISSYIFYRFLLLGVVVVKAADLAPVPPSSIASDAKPAASPDPRASEPNTLRLAHTLGSHMVLQQAPLPACLYGSGSPTAYIALRMDQALTPVVGTVVDLNGEWAACLPPQGPGGPHTITITGSGGRIVVEDVLFGDVWLCSGQSNMLMTMSQTLNATAEIAASGREAKGGARLRIMAIARNTSGIPLEDLSSPPLLPWSVVTPDTLGGPDWEYFSATCFFYGLHLTRHPRLTQIPIGLIQAAYGSTELKAWSPPEALDSCRPLPSSPSGRAPAPKVREGGTGRTGSDHSGVPRDARGNATRDAASASAVASPASPMTTATLPPEAPGPVPVDPPLPNVDTNSSHNDTDQANDRERTRTASLPVSPSTPSLPPARPPSRPP